MPRDISYNELVRVYADRGNIPAGSMLIRVDDQWVPLLPTTWPGSIFGIVGDYNVDLGTGTDFSTIINNALTLIGAGNTLDLSGCGLVMIGSPINIPAGTILKGPGTRKTIRWSSALGDWSVADDPGDFLVVKFGQGTTTLTSAAVRLAGESVIDGIAFWWPDQAMDSATPVVYPPAITGQSSGGAFQPTVKNCFFVDAYEGIHFEGSGTRYEVHNVQGFAADCFMYLDSIPDTSHFTNILDSYGNAYSGLPASNLKDYAKASGSFIRLGNVDGGQFVNCFANQKHKIIEIIADGGVGSLFLDLGTDGVVYGIYNNGFSYDRLLISGSGFSGDTDGYHIWWHPGAQAALLSITGSQLRGGHLGDIDGGTGFVFTGNAFDVGNVFGSTAEGLSLTDVEDFVIAGNLFDSTANLRSIEIANGSRGVISGNRFNGGSVEPDVRLSGTADFIRVENNTTNQQIAFFASDVSSGTHNVIRNNTGSNYAQTGLDAGPFQALTIASGAISIVRAGQVRVDTEAAAASDDLDTITIPAGVDGAIVTLRTNSSLRDVTVRSGVGNILLIGGNFTLATVDYRLTLIYDAVRTTWSELARAWPGGAGLDADTLDGLDSTAFQRVSTFAEDVSDQVGAMVTGNTETNITVTYQDSDNTLDFAVPAADTSTAGVSELATTAETITGTDATRTVTPAGLAGAIRGDNTTYTIATGAITLTNFGRLRIDTESAAATDDLDTINGGIQGAIVVFRSLSSSRDTTFKDGTGNMRLAGDFILTSADDQIMLIYDANTSVWYEIGRNDNA